jgi:hypothetical protein
MAEWREDKQNFYRRIAPEEGLQDLAQGFNPGNPSKQTVRPERGKVDSHFPEFC